MMKKVEVLILLALAAQMASGQWKQAPRPTFIPSISVLGSDNDYVYAATQNAFYRSLRGFYDWHRLDLPLSAHSLTIRTLAAENNRVIIGTNEGEVYGSDDAGLTWKKMAPGFSFGAVWSIVLKNGSVIVGSDKGIFVSNDRGNTWNASRLTGDGISVMTLLFFNDMIFAGTFGSGMFVSTDGGEQWVTADSGLTFPYITSLARKGNSIYAGTDDYFSDSVPVYESTDGGISWHEMSHGLPRPTHSRFVSFATEGSRLFAGTYGAGVYEFSERDSSWTSLNKGLMDYDLLTSSLLFDEGTILVANSNGVFKLDNADSTWVPVTKGLQMEEREILALARRDHLLLAGVNGNIYRSSNLGNDWQKATIVGTPGPATLCFLFHEDVIFAGTSYSLFRSLDNGISWHYAINGMGTPALTKQGPRVFASSADFYFHPFNSTVYVSENKGNTWSNSQFGSLSFRYVQALTSTPQHVFATSRNTVFRSDDGGLEWTSLKDALADSVSITRLHVVGDSLLAGTYDGIYISSDQGETWKSVSEGLPPKTAVYDLITLGSVHFAATHAGVFYTKNLSTSWQPYNEGLPADALRVNAILTAGNKLFIGTSAGVWTHQVDDLVTGISSPSQTPLYFSLHQNYPNPFNPATEIGYQISEVGYVTLKVYDVLGREVATLVNGEQEAGTYRVRWDAKGLPSGVYVYRLQANEYVETMKMVLMR